jgi:hypothetical protein
LTSAAIGEVFNRFCVSVSRSPVEFHPSSKRKQESPQVRMYRMIRPLMVRQASASLRIMLLALRA